jgi:hypothetical protein
VNQQAEILLLNKKKALGFSANQRTKENLRLAVQSINPDVNVTDANYEAMWKALLSFGIEEIDQLPRGTILDILQLATRYPRFLRKYNLGGLATKDEFLDATVGESVKELVTPLEIWTRGDLKDCAFAKMLASDEDAVLSDPLTTNSNLTSHFIVLCLLEELRESFDQETRVAYVKVGLRHYYNILRTNKFPLSVKHIDDSSILIISNKPSRSWDWKLRVLLYNSEYFADKIIPHEADVKIDQFRAWIAFSQTNGPEAIDKMEKYHAANADLNSVVVGIPNLTLQDAFNINSQDHDTISKRIIKAIEPGSDYTKVIDNIYTQDYLGLTIGMLSLLPSFCTNDNECNLVDEFVVPKVKTAMHQTIVKNIVDNADNSRIDDILGAFGLTRDTANVQEACDKKTLEQCIAGLEAQHPSGRI